MQEVSWPQVLAWRMGRQYLLEPTDGGVLEVARRLAGVQAQVPSAAALAVGIRQSVPDSEAIEQALLTDRTLLRTWAMRGTLHLLPADEAPAYLAMSGAHRNWEKPSAQKASGATPADLEAIAAAAEEALSDGAALTREQLTVAVVEATGLQRLAELLGSGWGALLKPLACWGVLCHGSANGGRVTFVSPARWLPDWPGIPDLDTAAGTVIRAYLRAYGPTTPDLFDRVWLSRGFVRKPLLRGWFAALEPELTRVRVDGAERVMLAEDLPSLLDCAPADEVLLLGGFDPYVLGTGTGSAEILPAAHRAEVSRAAGWISPVVLHRGRIVGTWQPDGGRVTTSLWEEVPAARLDAAIERIRPLL